MSICGTWKTRAYQSTVSEHLKKKTKMTVVTTTYKQHMVDSNRCHVCTELIVQPQTLSRSLPSHVRFPRYRHVIRFVELDPTTILFFFPTTWHSTSELFSPPHQQILLYLLFNLLLLLFNLLIKFKLHLKNVISPAIYS